MPPSTSVMSFTGSRLGVTAVTERDEKPSQSSPVYEASCRDGGGVSGFPQLHFTTGAPRSSTNTAVPAWRTAGMAVALPSTNPWLVTAVSERRTVAVSSEMYSVILSVSIPRTPAQAAASSGLSFRKALILAASHTALFLVPPYRPGVSPANVLDPPSAIVTAGAGAVDVVGVVVSESSETGSSSTWPGGAVSTPSIKGFAVAASTDSRWKLVALASSPQATTPERTSAANAARATDRPQVVCSMIMQPMVPMVPEKRPWRDPVRATSAGYLRHRPRSTGGTHDARTGDNDETPSSTGLSSDHRGS